MAALFTEAYGRVLAHGLIQPDLALPAQIAKRSPLAEAWPQFDKTLDEFTSCQLIAA